MSLNDINLDWWLEDTINRVPARQREESEKAIEGLHYFVNHLSEIKKDDNGNVIPYSTGPHSFKAFQMFAASIQEPERVLEIGFNLGHGAAALLAVFPRSKVYSIDIRDSSEVHNAHKVLQERHKDRHAIWIGDSKSVTLTTLGTFQAAFIDGAHDFDSIMWDINLCRKWGVKNFLMDDVHPRYGDTLEAIKQSGLKLHAIVGANMAICEDL